MDLKKIITQQSICNKTQQTAYYYLIIIVVAQFYSRTAPQRTALLLAQRTCRRTAAPIREWKAQTNRILIKYNVLSLLIQNLAYKYLHTVHRHTLTRRRQAGERKCARH